MLLSQVLLAGPVLTGLLSADGDLAEVASMNGRQLIGIPMALVGAVLLSFGAQYQSRGLNKVERIVGQSAGSGLSLRHILSMLRRPSWVIGTLLLGLAVVFQIGSLSFAPLIVVQPIGVVALVVTAVLNSRMSGVRLGRRAQLSVALAVGGIVAFVTIAAFSAADRPVTDAKLITILIAFGVVFLLALVLFVLFRHRGVALIYIVGSGVLYGFVATFAKSVIGRLQQGEFEWLTWACVLALVLGALLGMVFVQNAYSSGPPDLVVAGLTVIDPIVAVLIGIVVLGEAASASGLAIAAFVVSGAVAVVGVLGLAKHHPQVGKSHLPAVTGRVPVPEERAGEDG
ncbi:DMT family transporter [Leucobacter chromiisoli]|uniref:DMT family transporter n=1 Tax=Leucobacter chromiisoli TaxID=2796471 RepID=UPI0027DB0739|nr:DMT family transporter [Leucobacter chromiisoli]